MHVSGLLEETVVPGGNPHRNRENMQTTDPKPVCSDTLLSQFWESIFDEEKYSFSMDRQLKKSHFYKFSLVCVFFVGVFFRKGAYVIFSICADKGFFFLHWQQRRETGSCKRYLLQNIYY